jgi:hypothetical protein
LRRELHEMRCVCVICLCILPLPRHSQFLLLLGDRERQIEAKETYKHFVRFMAPLGMQEKKTNFCMPDKV